MAKPTWLITTPSQGSGNGVIQNSANAHTGRISRTGIATVTGEGIATPKTYTVTQEPKAEFVSFDNGSEMAANKGGGTITISGKSNSSTLSFAWLGNVTDVTLPANYQANGTTTNNGVAITGDPGASAEFAFSLSLSIPTNTSVDEVSRTLKVTAQGAQMAQIVIKQAAGDPTLELSTTEITIPQAGTPAVSVTVTSNTAWAVS